MDEESPHPVFPDDRLGDEGEESDEAEDDHAPVPLEMIAASFEAAKPELIEDNDDALAPTEQIASPFDGHGDEEMQVDEFEDDHAPLPPETIAASYEAAKPTFIENNDDASIPTEQQVASPFDGHGDDNAPLPPEMIAASFEALMPELYVDKVSSLLPKIKPASVKEHENEQQEVDYNGARAPFEIMASSFEVNHFTEYQAKNNLGLLEDNDGANMNNIQDIFDSIDEGGALESNSSSYSSFQDADKDKTTTVLDPSSTVNDQGHVGISIYPSQEVMTRPRLGIDPSYQSAPLLEATLVEDKHEEPVYDAFPIGPVQNDYAHGWSRKFQKYRLIILGLLSITVTAIIAVAVVASSGRRDKRSELFKPPVAFSIWEQQGRDITGRDADDLLGWTVALSADARTLVAGAPGLYKNDKKKGYVEVYYKDDVMDLVQTIHGDAFGDVFGYSVDITADGKTLAIGSPGEYTNFDRPGYVRVYHQEGSDGPRSSWTQREEDIVGEAIGDMFGNSVSLSDDGKTLAVGAYLNGEMAGHVRVYRLKDDSTRWEQLGQDIDGEEPCDNSGHSLSLSGDGTTLAIGAPYNSGNGEYAGHVKVYRFDGDKSSWEKLGQTIMGDNELDNAGYSVAISANGTILAVGFSGYYYYSEPNRPGYVRVYHLEGGGDELISFSWKQIGQNITGEGIGDNFGASVILSDDAMTLAVGADYNSGPNGKYAGHVRVYRLYDSNSTWTQIGEDIDGKAPEDYSGSSSTISLSGDGKKLAIGSYGHDSNGTDAGQVRIFFNK